MTNLRRPNTQERNLGRIIGAENTLLDSEDRKR